MKGGMKLSLNDLARNESIPHLEVNKSVALN